MDIEVRIMSHTAAIGRWNKPAPLDETLFLPLANKQIHSTESYFLSEGDVESHYLA